MKKTIAANIRDLPVAERAPEALRTTLLELVQGVQEFSRSDHETVAVMTDLINSGRVVLTDTFARRRLVVVPNP